MHGPSAASGRSTPVAGGGASSAPASAAAGSPRYSTIDWVSAADEALPSSARASAAVTVQLFSCAVVTGLVCAMMAAGSETVTHWLTDLKSGHCADFPFATQELCCQLESTRAASIAELASRIAGGGPSAGEGGSCPHWVSLFGLGPSGEATVSWSHLGWYIAVGTALAVLAATMAAPGRDGAGAAVAGSGIVEIKAFLAGVELPAYFRPIVLVRKSLGLCASVGSGLAVGKEGPFVHLGSCAAAAVSNVLPAVGTSTLLRREIVSAGAAAGVAVAFGAPLGGVLFVLEETGFVLSRRCVLVCLVASVVATLALKSINPTGTGRIVQFAVSHRLPWHWFELPVFALLGVIGGGFGVFVVRANTFLYHSQLGGPRSSSSSSVLRSTLGRFRAFAKRHAVLHVAGLAMASGLVSYSSPLLRRGMLEVLRDLFLECGHHHGTGSPAASTTPAPASAAAPPIVSGTPNNGLQLFASLNAAQTLCSGASTAVVMHLLVAALMKALLMATVMGARLPQGCFVPALFVGAAVGRALGEWVQTTYRAAPGAALFSACGSDLGTAAAAINLDCVAPGVYAVVGAAAALTGLTRMTLSIAVIMFELTGGLDYIAPCLLASLVASYVAGSSAIAGPSVYEAQLERSALPYVEVDPADGGFHPDLARNIAELVPAASAAGVSVLWEGMSLREVRSVVDLAGAPGEGAGAAAAAEADGDDERRRRHRFYPVMGGEQSSEFVGCVEGSAARRRLSEAASMGVAETTIVTFGCPSSAAVSRGRGRGQLADWAGALEPVTVRLSTSATVRHALLAFETLGTHHVVVCRGDQFAAMLTRRDVVGFLRHGGSEPKPARRGQRSRAGSESSDNREELQTLA